jgi:hypothetical protein
VIQRRTVAGIVVAATLSMLAGCGFESPDVESSEHASVQAADFSVGAVRVRDVFVTSTHPLSGAVAPVHLVVTFVNDGTTADALTGVTSSLGPATLSGTGVQAVGATGSALILPPRAMPVEVGDPKQTPNGPTITIAAATQPVVGTFVRVTFTFANAGSSSSEQVPVVPPGETTVPTQPVPTATASVPSEVGVSASD